MSDVPITDQDFLNDSTLIDQEATSILEKHTLAANPNALATFVEEELDEEADVWAEIGRAFAASYMGDWRYSIYHGWAEWNGPALGHAVCPGCPANHPGCRRQIDLWRHPFLCSGRGIQEDGVGLALQRPCDDFLPGWMPE